MSRLRARPAQVWPVEVIRCIYDAFESGEFRTPGNYFRDDVEAYVSDFLPWGGEWHGMAQLREGLRMMRRYVTLSFEVSEFLEAGDCIVAVGRTSGVVHATCEPFSVIAVHVWHLDDDGKVAGVEYYIDEALGALFKDAPLLEVPYSR